MCESVGRRLTSGSCPQVPRLQALFCSSLHLSPVFCSPLEKYKDDPLFEHLLCINAWCSVCRKWIRKNPLVFLASVDPVSPHGSILSSVSQEAHSSHPLGPAASAGPSGVKVPVHLHQSFPSEGSTLPSRPGTTRRGQFSPYRLPKSSRQCHDKTSGLPALHQVLSAPLEYLQCPDTATQTERRKNSLDAALAIPSGPKALPPSEVPPSPRRQGRAQHNADSNWQDHQKGLKQQGIDREQEGPLTPAPSSDHDSQNSLTPSSLGIHNDTLPPLPAPHSSEVTARREQSPETSLSQASSPPTTSQANRPGLRKRILSCCQNFRKSRSRGRRGLTPTVGPLRKALRCCLPCICGRSSS